MEVGGKTMKTKRTLSLILTLLMVLAMLARVRW